MVAVADFNLARWRIPCDEAKRRGDESAGAFGLFTAESVAYVAFRPCDFRSSNILF